MIINNEEYSELKDLILQTYFMARDCGAMFMMENLDRAMEILQKEERKQSIRKNKFKK